MMTQSEQMKLVLLYAMNEIGGGGKRHLVLQHINDNSYWHKNDTNDVLGTTRPSESKWWNNFSYERQHLVADGYMKAGGDGNWIITERGKEYLSKLIEQAQNIPPEENRLFTLAFYQKLFSAPLSIDGIALDEKDEEAQYIARIAVEDMDSVSVPDAFSNEPERKRTSRISGSRIIYPRDSAVAKRALSRANHLCEANPSHVSFLRRNGHVLYMEPHHLIPISFTDYFGVNLDREQNIFSLCSNCHNQIHYGKKEDVRKLIAKLFFSRAQEICSILGREISIEDIYRIYGVL